MLRSHTLWSQTRRLVESKQIETRSAHLQKQAANLLKVLTSANKRSKSADIVGVRRPHSHVTSFGVFPQSLNWKRQRLICLQRFTNNVRTRNEHTMHVKKHRPFAARTDLASPPPQTSQTSRRLAERRTTRAEHRGLGRVRPRNAPAWNAWRRDAGGRGRPSGLARHGSSHSWPWLR